MERALLAAQAEPRTTQGQEVWTVVSASRGRWGKTQPPCKSQSSRRREGSVKGVSDMLRLVPSLEDTPTGARQASLMLRPGQNLLQQTPNGELMNTLTASQGSNGIGQL